MLYSKGQCKGISILLYYWRLHFVDKLLNLILQDTTKNDVPMNNDSMILRSDSDVVSNKSSLSQPVAEENVTIEQFDDT